ncbi:MAG TPA: anti-sigma factor [Roseiflexaceae bacterium]
MTAPQDDILDLLAAYALDALEPEDITRLHTLLEERPDLRATLAELRATVNQLPYALPEATPPPDLRQRVLDHATGRAERKPAALAVMPGRVRSWLLALGGLAAAAIVVAAIGWGQVVGLQAELAQTRGTLAEVQATAEAQQQIIASLAGDGHGTLMRTPSGETVLVVKLPPLKPGRTYQLWRIQGDTPISAGLFTVDDQGVGAIAMAPGQQPQAGETIAVTDEPVLGSPQPTMKPLIAGKVQAF